GLRTLFQFLIDVGADAVISHHPHVPGPYELYKGKPIVYSLGNLIFDTQKPPPEWDQGYLAGLELDFENLALKGVRLELYPYRQAVADGGLQLMGEVEREAFLARIEEM